MMINNEKQLLTDEEKEYLKNVVKPYQELITTVVKNGWWYPTLYIWLRPVNGSSSSIDIPLCDEVFVFEGLEPKKHYTL